MNEATSEEIEIVKERYISLIRERTKVRKLTDESFAIETHHVNSNNDPIEVHVKKRVDIIGESFGVSDGGVILFCLNNIIRIIKRLDGGSGDYKSLLEYLYASVELGRNHIQYVDEEDVAETIMCIAEAIVIAEGALKNITQYADSKIEVEKRDE